MVCNNIKNFIFFIAEYNLLKNDENTITKSNILNNFNCSDKKFEQPIINSKSSTVISESLSLTEKHDFKPIFVNKTPRDFFFIRILGEGSFSTVKNNFFLN